MLRRTLLSLIPAGILTLAVSPKLFADWPDFSNINFKDAESKLLEITEYMDKELNKRWMNHLSILSIDSPAGELPSEEDYKRPTIKTIVVELERTEQITSAIDCKLSELNPANVERMIDILYTSFKVKYDRDLKGKFASRINIYFDPHIWKNKRFGVYGWCDLYSIKD
jgi:hypothetical protein